MLDRITNIALAIALGVMLGCAVVVVGFLVLAYAWGLL